MNGKFIRKLFFKARKKNAKLLLKTQDPFELIEELSIFLDVKIESLAEDYKKKRISQIKMSEVLCSSLLMGHLLSGKEIYGLFDEYTKAENVKKQLKYTKKKLNEFSTWKSIKNYKEYVEILLGLLDYLEYDFLDSTTDFPEIKLS